MALNPTAIQWFSRKFRHQFNSKPANLSSSLWIPCHEWQTKTRRITESLDCVDVNKWVTCLGLDAFPLEKVSGATKTRIRSHP